MSDYSSKEQIKPRFSASLYKEGRFISSFDNREGSRVEFFKAMWSLFTDYSEDMVPLGDTVPVVKLSKDAILNLEGNSVIRLSHATLLFKLDGKLVLTDPVFSDRASPVSFFGPKRFHEMPISIEELPFIDAIIISHNHYDHLDKYSIKSLKDKVGNFYTTLGVKNLLVEFGVEPSKVTELDWWESAQNDSLTLIATPSQHFSSRSLFDKNKTLWSSWVVKSSKASIYFGADSGYFDGFKEIGNTYGPFDMTFLEAGAYNELWKSIHMMPKESVQAHLDLNGKIMFPIHNGTFKLSNHTWREPLEIVTQEATLQDVRLVHPMMGESIPLLRYQKTNTWWKN